MRKTLRRHRGDPQAARRRWGIHPPSTATTTQESGLRENRTSRLSERTEEGRKPDLLRLYSGEAGEQRRATVRGVGGAKGEGRGERGSGPHAPGSGPGKRVKGAGPRTASCKTASPSDTQGGSRVPELGPLGSVRGALSNERPYRD